MKKTRKTLKVVVLDDSDFYNRLLTHELESYCKMLSLKFPVTIEIDSFSDLEMFSRRLEKSIDLAFVDFYLSSEMNGDEVTRKILEKHSSCKVVIISQSNSVPTSAKTRKSGATEFIHKDKYAIENACLSLHQYVMNERDHLTKERAHA